MSHIATVEVHIRDIAALDRACQRLGLELRRNQTTYKWWGNTGPRENLNVEQLTAAIRTFDKDFARPDFLSAEDWRAGRCCHAIGLPGSEHGLEIGVTRSADGQGFTLLGDLMMLSSDLLAKVGGAKCGKLTQAYSLEVSKRTMQLKGFQVSERVVNGNLQLICRK